MERTADRGADVLSDVLDALRLRGEVFCRANRRGAWGLALPARDIVYFHAVARGSCWLERDDAEPLLLRAGDVVMLVDGREHRLVDEPGRAATPLSVVLATPFCDFGVEDSDADSVVICGGFELDRRVIHPLIALLPPLVSASRSDGEALLEPIIALLAAESLRAAPGLDAVVRRFTEILFVATLRAWLPQQPALPASWLAALRDTELSRALAALHADPSHGWTVAELAAACGLARSRFAERFTALVGLAPMTYLARWRMQLAAHLLATTDLSVADIAAHVGYASDAAFTRAFRAATNRTPASWRRS